MMTGNHKKNSNTADRSDSKKSDGFSRRDFMKRSGFALAGTLLASQAGIAVNTAPRKVRIGVVGGGFGCSFQWHEHPDCIVQAVSDLREDRRKRLMKVYSCKKAYSSLEELVLAKDIDAVAIFTDGPLHVQHTVEAMKNGKHVMSFFAPHPNGLGPVIIRSGESAAGGEKGDAGFLRKAPNFEHYKQPHYWWKTDMLPEPLRHNSGHEGSHAFLTHEFVDALVHNRRPAIDVYESLAYTVPGIVAHESALKKGERIKIPQYERLA